jgi:hypothetical protein
VLWFEADLYDQLQLIQVVHRLAELAVDSTRVTLVSIGEYPGMARPSTQDTGVRDRREDPEHRAGCD